MLDAHSEARQATGIRVQKVLRNVDDPNEVFLLFEVSDLEKARDFVSSSEVPDVKQQSGVVDSPDIYCLF